MLKNNQQSYSNFYRKNGENLPHLFFVDVRQEWLPWK